MFAYEIIDFTFTCMIHYERRCLPTLLAKHSSMCSRSKTKGTSPVFMELTVCESRQVIEIEWHRCHDSGKH